MKRFGKRKGNLLDEMQQQTVWQIQSRCYRLTNLMLLAAFLIQIVTGAQREQWLAEWTVFLAGNLYLAAQCLRQGIWGQWLRPNLRTVGGLSLLAGALAGVAAGLGARAWWCGLLAGVCTGLLCFAALAACLHLYRDRHRKMEERLDREEEG